MEIDITAFVMNAEPAEYSASVAEIGANAGPTTWNNAKREAERTPLLTTPEQLEALRSWAEATGAWDDDERAAWTPADCNALFIQLVSGDMREAGMDETFPDEFDWQEYEERSSAGQVSGSIYRGDDDRIYYCLEG
jgi:hypothetical protein